MSGHGGAEVPHEHGNDPFTKRVALSVAVFAVILAVAGTAGKNAGKELISEQLNASNTWNQYQAKTQRELIYQQELEAMIAEGMEIPANAEAIAKEYEKNRKAKTTVGDPVERKKQRLAFIVTKLAEYEKEKKELFDKAKGHEAHRDKAHTQDPFFDFAELCLQIAIVLASVAMLSKARWPFYASMALALIGIVLTLNGFLLLVVPGHGSAGH